MKKIVLFLGIPMCGKGVSGKFATELHAAICWVMRDMIKHKSEVDLGFAALAEGHEIAGTLIPDEPINLLLKTHLDFGSGNLHILDGAGRNLEQMKYLIDLLAAHGVNDKQIRVVHFRMTAEESRKRFEKKHNAPDRAGRRDAKLDTHMDRVRSHELEEPAILGYLQNLGIRICEVQAGSDDVLDKLERIQNYLDLPAPTPDNLLRAFQKILPEEVAALEERLLQDAA